MSHVADGRRGRAAAAAVVVARSRARRAGMRLTRGYIAERESAGAAARKRGRIARGAEKEEGEETRRAARATR